MKKILKETSLTQAVDSNQLTEVVEGLFMSMDKDNNNNLDVQEVANMLLFLASSTM